MHRYRMMKHILTVLAMPLLISLLFLTTSVDAHPGNTSSDGAHYCWTRCDYWGEVYGERHYHGGGYAAPEPEYEPEYEYYEPEPEYEPDYEYDDYSPDYDYDDSPAASVATSASEVDETSDEGGSDWLWWVGGISGLLVVGKIAEHFDK